MIQRRQSIYLLLSVVLLASLIFWPIDFFFKEPAPDGTSVPQAVELHWNSILDVTDPSASQPLQSLFYLAALVLLPLMLNALAIFMFKNRPLQGRMAGIALGIEVGLSAVLVYLSIDIQSLLDAPFHFCVRWIVPLVAAVLDFLAYKAISDDEALVRSLDRLR